MTFFVFSHSTFPSLPVQQLRHTCTHVEAETIAVTSTVQCFGLERCSHSQHYVGTHFSSTCIQLHLYISQLTGLLLTSKLLADLVTLHLDHSLASLKSYITTAYICVFVSLNPLAAGRSLAIFCLLQPNVCRQTVPMESIVWRPIRYTTLRLVCGFYASVLTAHGHARCCFPSYWEKESIQREARGQTTGRASDVSLL